MYVLSSEPSTCYFLPDDDATCNHDTAWDCINLRVYYGSSDTFLRLRDISVRTTISEVINVSAYLASDWFGWTEGGEYHIGLRDAPTILPLDNILADTLPLTDCHNGWHEVELTLTVEETGDIGSASNGPPPPVFPRNPLEFDEPQ